MAGWGGGAAEAPQRLNAAVPGFVVAGFCAAGVAFVLACRACAIGDGDHLSAPSGRQVGAGGISELGALPNRANA